MLWLETLALLGTLVSSSGLGKLQEVQAQVHGLLSKKQKIKGSKLLLVVSRAHVLFCFPAFLAQQSLWTHTIDGLLENTRPVH